MGLMTLTQVQAFTEENMCSSRASIERVGCRSTRVGFTDEPFWPSPYCRNPNVVANGNNVAASIVAQQSSTSSPSSGKNINNCQNNLKHRQQLVEQDTRNRVVIEACVQLCSQFLLVSGQNGALVRASNWKRTLNTDANRTCPNSAKVQPRVPCNS